jgi:hypothetical protein
MEKLAEYEDEDEDEFPCALSYSSSKTQTTKTRPTLSKVEGQPVPPAARSQSPIPNTRCPAGLHERCALRALCLRSGSRLDDI